MALLASGCIIADPPLYEEPRKTPPFLDLYAATPRPSEILVFDSMRDNSVEFVVPVRSEDDGDDLFAVLYLDYAPHLPARDLARDQEPASTLSDSERELNLVFTTSGQVIPAGCHTLTLLVTHESNFDFVKFIPKTATNTAVAVWWMNLDPPSQYPYDLIGCPNPSQEIER